MNFTREPIIETVVTPRDGCKLVVRSSKGNGQEDYFVDAVEVVSFGHSLFFRSLEKPKSFLVPVSDYEVLELRETRMVLKHVPTERSMKIGGGSDKQPPRQSREQHQEPRHQEKEAEPAVSTTDEEVLDPLAVPTAEAGAVPAGTADRKRERRRRGRRGRSERAPDGSTPATAPVQGESSLDASAQDENQETAADVDAVKNVEHPQEESTEPKPAKAPSLLSRLFLAPPPPLMMRRVVPKPIEPPKDPEPTQEHTPVSQEEAKQEVLEAKEESTQLVEEKPFVPEEQKHTPSSQLEDESDLED